MKLKFVKDHQDAVIPMYATEGSSGFDLHSVKDETLKPGERKMISTGLRAEIPIGKEIQIRPRSGFAKNQGVTVLNTPGTVDADYKGVIHIILINNGNDPVIITKGDRIAQGVFANVEQAEIVEGTEEDLTTSIRGTGGFGSTGK